MVMADQEYADQGVCPICKGGVTGDEHAKFFCQKCNILFSLESLVEAKKSDEEE